MEYVNAFMFDETMQKVLLIRKNKPDWQRGLLNGVGGKLEEGEDIFEAICREFHEEVGIATSPEDWKYFLDYRIRDDHKVHFFVTSSSKVHSWEQKEEEKPVFINVNNIGLDKYVSNLEFIIPLGKWFIENKDYMIEPVRLRES